MYLKAFQSHKKAGAEFGMMNLMGLNFLLIGFKKLEMDLGDGEIMNLSITVLKTLPYQMAY